MDPISVRHSEIILELVPLGQFLDSSFRKEDQLVPGRAVVAARTGVDPEEAVVEVEVTTGEVEAVVGGAGLQEEEVTVGGAMAMDLGMAEVVEAVGGAGVGEKATRSPLKSRRIWRQPQWRLRRMRSLEKILGSISRLTKTFLWRQAGRTVLLP